MGHFIWVSAVCQVPLQDFLVFKGLKFKFRIMSNCKSEGCGRNYKMSLTQNSLKLWEGLGTVFALNILTVGFKQN